jgi:TPR repeat protein
MFRMIIMATLTVLLSCAAYAQSAKERQCANGSGEDCFFAAADFATGKGVPENKQIAQRLFLQACEKGIPDGCHYAGTMSRKGQGNVPMNMELGISYHERACRMGHEDGCDSVYRALMMDGDYRDIPRGLIAMEAGCARGALKACGYGAVIFNDGGSRNLTQYIDQRRAGPMAGNACDKGNASLCPIAENSYLNPDSPAFNAAKGLRYATMNCDNGVKESCSNLGGIYHQIEDYESATRMYERSCELGNESVCKFARDWRKALTERAAWEAERAAEKRELDNLINARRYGDAINVALYQMRSSRQAEYATSAAMRANAMSQVGTQDLYVLASWFQSGPIRDAADREMRARGTGLEGTFGTGTNNAGQAAERYRSLYGSSMPTQRSSPSISNPPAGPSVSQVREQARRDFRNAHCNMNSSKSLHACR